MSCEGGSHRREHSTVQPITPDLGQVPTKDDSLQQLSSVCVLTPAKVNLYLGVHSELDERRYHRVDSVMAALALFDEVVAEKSDSCVISIEPDLGIEAADSNVGHAVRWLAEAVGVEPAVRVYVRRRIPLCAGLGGSSSDAGGTLRALCRLWGIDPHDARVAQVARRIGADVPFFLDPRPSYLTGGGDKLVESFPPLPAMPVVLVKPADGVSTAVAYADFDRNPSPCGDLAAMCDALRRGDFAGVMANLSNNLDPVACRLLLAISEAKRWLSEQSGVVRVMVSGSGSCVFGVCEAQTETGSLVRAAEERGWWSCATKFLSEEFLSADEQRIC